MPRPVGRASRRGLRWNSWAAAIAALLLTRPAAAQAPAPDSLAAIVDRAEGLRTAGDLAGARVLLLALPERALAQPRPDTITAARAELALARIERDLNHAN